jgi:hypothetical protein
MLNQMIGGNGGDALMGDETAHLKQQANVSVEILNGLLCAVERAAHCFYWFATDATA